MKLYAPRYYKDFACIAERCKHSCCVGWEIDVDGAALEKYALLKPTYGKEISDSIDYTETPHFKLMADERCPHLDERGLCKIITALGEEYLCDICREHPRFYNDTLYGKEVGLGMACEEACRIILSSDAYADRIEIGEAEGASLAAEFDAVAEREKIYGILQTFSLRYDEKRKKICEKYDVSLSLLTAEEWRECLASLEYLDEAHRALFASFDPYVSVKEAHEKILDRAFAYFLYRHTAETGSMEEFRAALVFCLFCEKLVAYLIHATEAEREEEIVEAARTVSEEIEYSEDNPEELLFAIGIHL